MTNETQTSNDVANSTDEAAKNRPTHMAKIRHGEGENATYEQIGVAWKSESGSLYIKLNGTQIVSSFALYEIKPKKETGAEA